MNKKTIAISKDFKLPLDLVTQTVAILAKKGSGKSYTGSIIAEGMLDAGQQVIVIDPTGAWWGLKSSADGKHEGFPVVVFGGDHADLPLEEHAGELLAQSIKDQKFSAILDLSLLRKGAAQRFMRTFLETLYRINRDPVHLIVDEADSFAPQRAMNEEAFTLGAMEDIVRRGRIRGIGCTLITQRAAVLNKNVLTQCEVLVALRMVHPKDINALKEWVDVHAEEDQAQIMVNSLPSLPIGTAWFWSPGWGHFFEKVKVRHRNTFDSGATPIAGQRAVQDPKVMAKVDLEKLGNEMQRMVEQVKSNDPKELKRQVQDLQRQLERAGTKEPAVKEVRVEVPIFKKSSDALLAKCVAAYEKAVNLINTANERLSNLQDIATIISTVNSKPPSQPVTQPSKYLMPIAAPRFPVASMSPPKSGLDKEGTPGKAERAILNVLANNSGRAVTKRKIAVSTGYAAGGGGFNNALAKCRGRGWMVSQSDFHTITEEGLKALGPVDPLPTGSALAQYWYAQLGKAEKSILQQLINAYPTALTKEEISGLTGYEPNGGGFNNALGKLRTLELIIGHKEMCASTEFFD